MDIQTAKAIDRVRTDLRRVDTKLRKAIAELATKAELREAIAEATAGLATKGQLLATAAELREGLADNRRHAEVLTESVRDDIRIVAEGLALLGEKVDRLIPNRLGA
jgi:hypothetical protein